MIYEMQENKGKNANYISRAQVVIVRLSHLFELINLHKPV